MKRFWLFAGVSYYPVGGMNDFVKSFDSFDEAASALDDKFAAGEDWGHIFDTETKQVSHSKNRHGCVLETVVMNFE